jgi:hypothetical protein
MKKDVRRVLDVLHTLSHQFDKARADWELVGKHITNALRKSEDVAKDLGEIDNSIKSLALKRGQQEILHETD